MMNFISGWKDKLTKYVDVRLSLLKLGLIERTSSVLGFVMFSFIALFITLLILIFIGIGLQETFSVLVDSRIGGAFLTAGFFLLLAVLIIGLRKQVLNGFSSLFIGMLTAQDDDDEDDKDGSAETTAGERIKVA